MATSAARPMTEHVMWDRTSAEIVVCISPGSEERREPKTRRTSRVVCVGAWKRAPRAMSSAFCREGCPFGSSWRSFCRREMWSFGFPETSDTRMARPSLMPIIPSWEMGFCSKNSVTNSVTYRSMRRYLVGRRSLSAITAERSSTRRRCRMMPLCKGVVSFSSLHRVLVRTSW